MTARPGSPCDRSRALISRGLDGALTEVERRLLARHVARCPGCREFRETITTATAELRSAPLLVPERPIAAPLGLRRNRSRLRSAARVGAAAAAVAMVGNLAIGDDSLDRSSRALPAPPPPAALPGGDDAIRALRVEALRAGELPILPVPPYHGKVPLPASDG